MKKPSVIFFNRVYPPGRGATGRVLRDLARSFVRDGWDVTVVTSGPHAGRDRDGAIRVIRVRARQRKQSVMAYGWIWFKMLLASLTLARPNLIVTMTDPPLLVVLGRIVSRMKKCKHMHWCQDVYPDLLPVLGMSLPKGLQEKFLNLSHRAMKDSDKVVVIGRCMARHLTHQGMDPRRIAVIPNWPDFELVGTGRRSRRLMAIEGASRSASPAVPRKPRKVEKPEGKPFAQLFRDRDPKFRILYSGNIGRAHPVDTVLDAASLLSEDHPEIEFVFVGDGPNFDRLAHDRTKRGLHNIRFLPWQPASRLRELMESGDLHLVTMREETAGLLVPSKLYSAMAVGRPCIFVGPANSETARIIHDFKAGSIVPNGNAVRLADTIRHYRLNSDAWFAAHEGALKAGRIFLPEESIRAWLDRARDVAQLPLRTARRKTA